MLKKINCGEQETTLDASEIYRNSQIWQNPKVVMN